MPIYTFVCVYMCYVCANVGMRVSVSRTLHSCVTPTSHKELFCCYPCTHALFALVCIATEWLASATKGRSLWCNSSCRSAP